MIDWVLVLLSPRVWGIHLGYQVSSWCSFVMFISLFIILLSSLQVAYDPAPEGVNSLLSGLPGSSVDSSASVGGWRGVFRSAVRGVVSDVKNEVMAELSSSMNDVNSVERRYMAKDPSDAVNRVQMKD